MGLRREKFGACCFWTQQAAEKAQKAFLMSKGERLVLEHSAWFKRGNTINFESERSQAAVGRPQEIAHRLCNAFLRPAGCEPRPQATHRSDLTLQNRRNLNHPEHSVAWLARMCATHDPSFANLTQSGLVLDRYYIPTRHPNGLPYPAAPSRASSDSDAEEAIRLGESIVNKVTALIPRK